MDINELRKYILEKKARGTYHGGHVTIEQGGRETDIGAAVFLLLSSIPNEGINPQRRDEIKKFERSTKGEGKEIISWLRTKLSPKGLVNEIKGYFSRSEFANTGNYTFKKSIDYGEDVYL